jgi:glutathione S-transferase
MGRQSLTHGGGVVDWVQLVLTGGVSLAILFYLAMLFERRILPGLEKRTQEDREERRQERREWDEKERQFITTLQQINASLAANTRAVEQLATGFQRMETEAKVEAKRRERERGTR